MMIPRFSLLVLALGTPALAAPMDEAEALFKTGKFPEARAAFEAIATADPQNAAACSYLAQAIVRSGSGPKALDEALPWMEKAATAAPNDPAILSSYGRLCMELAGIHTSISSARKGRDALEAAIKLKPEDLEAREILYAYYTQAPWPLGSSSKAAAQLEEISKRDPRRGAALSINTKVHDKDYAAVFKLCDDLLAKDPNDWFALFHYGRTAAISGQNLKQGLASLQKYLALAPTAANAPKPANIWGRIGNIDEKLGDSAGARSAYETALQLEPKNKSVAAALANLK